VRLSFAGAPVSNVSNRLCVWMEEGTGELEVALIVGHAGRQLFWTA
jgi:hypothetical protein